MFRKGTMKDQGIDITLKNNPDHFLSPNDWDMVLAARMHKITYKEYRTWYFNLIRERWAVREAEFRDLAREGVDKDIYLKCFCTNSEKNCHVHLAVELMNKLVKQFENQKVTGDAQVPVTA